MKTNPSLRLSGFHIKNSTNDNLNILNPEIQIPYACIPALISNGEWLPNELGIVPYQIANPQRRMIDCC